MKKLLAIIALLLAMVLLLTSCGEKKEESAPAAETKTEEKAEAATEEKKKEAAPAAAGIEGTWKLTAMKMEGMSEEEAEQYKTMIESGQIVMTMSFDGTNMVSTQAMSGQEMTIKGTYTVDGNKLTVIEEGSDNPNGDPVEFKLDGDTLEIISEGTMVFTRQK